MDQSSAHRVHSRRGTQIGCNKCERQMTIPTGSFRGQCPSAFGMPYTLLSAFILGFFLFHVNSCHFYLPWNCFALFTFNSKRTRIISDREGTANKFNPKRLNHLSSSSPPSPPLFTNLPPLFQSLSIELLCEMRVANNSRMRF